MTKKVLQVSTFRPEQCGIASWTEDVINYCHNEDPSLRNRVMVMNGFRDSSEYGDFADIILHKNDRDAYTSAAKKVNMDDEIGVVSVQHEFGIFGDPKGREFTGEFLFDFLDALKKPVITTCHTVPSKTSKDPKSQRRREALAGILTRSDKILAISETAKNLLIDEYGVDPEKVRRIYHGVHTFNETPNHSKQVLGLEDRFVLSTVGLVRKKRGIEDVIRALPDVVERHPEILYVVAGKAHPKEIESNGREPYRELLVSETRRLDLEKNVSFVDNYLPLSSLLRHINASEICITPYTEPGQVSSGVLSYGMGLLKPVLSTPFLYAQEVLADGRGIILPDFENPESIAIALLDALGDTGRLREMERKIEPFVEQMRWPNVAKIYIEEERKLMAHN